MICVVIHRLPVHIRSHVADPFTKGEPRKAGLAAGRRAQCSSCTNQTEASLRKCALILSRRDGRLMPVQRVDFGVKTPPTTEWHCDPQGNSPGYAHVRRMERNSSSLQGTFAVPPLSPQASFDRTVPSTSESKLLGAIISSPAIKPTTYLGHLQLLLAAAPFSQTSNNSTTLPPRYPLCPLPARCVYAQPGKPLSPAKITHMNTACESPGFNLHLYRIINGSRSRRADLLVRGDVSR